MRFMEPREFLISTLSPVHIGCGEDYEPGNYVIDDDMLHAFDPGQLLMRLTEQQRDELLRALDDRNPVLASQRFFYRHKELACEIAHHRAPVAQEAARLYASRVGKAANREQGGKTVINKLEIARTAFNPLDQHPVLPGSSLKGAMRTALLESLREGRRYPLSDQDAAKDAAKARIAGQKAREMEQDILAGSFQTDPLRLLKVADARFLPGSYKVKNAQGVEQQRERQARQILFQVNRKKRPNQFAAGGDIETLVECIPAGQPRAFAGSLVIEGKARQGQNSPSIQIDWALLANACNDFYLSRFDQELSLLEKNQFVSSVWAANARKRLDAGGIWGKLIDTGQGFLLRVGRHSGAESVTIDAPRKIKIMKGKGSPPEWRDAATTVWLAANERGAGGNMWPFGWVFVQLVQPR